MNVSGRKETFGMNKNLFCKIDECTNVEINAHTENKCSISIYDGLCVKSQTKQKQTVYNNCTF
jgi:hypothetical protein